MAVAARGHDERREAGLHIERDRRLSEYGLAARHVALWSGRLMCGRVSEVSRVR